MTNEHGGPNPDATNEILDALLSGAGLEVFPEGVRDEVDTVLAAGQSLEPGARRKLIEAAQRGARERKLRESAVLETLLFKERQRHGWDAEAIATALGLDPAVVHSIERGEVGIADQSSEVVAAWALALHLDRALLGDSLRRSLAPQEAAHAYAGERSVHLDPTQERFIADVLQAYDERATGGAG